MDDCFYCNMTCAYQERMVSGGPTLATLTLRVGRAGWGGRGGQRIIVLVHRGEGLQIPLKTGHCRSVSKTPFKVCVASRLMMNQH